MKRKILLAVIPARGGSKSIPGKNLALAGGKPLIAHTIEVALAARCISRVIVSTDSSAIADVARQYGAEVPFIRPAELAQDDTPGIMPVLHAVRWLEEREQWKADYVLLLQPTSPLRSVSDIEASVQLAVDRHADAVVSVCLTERHPYWMKRVTEDGLLVDFVPHEKTYLRRQELPPAYAVNGAIYLVTREVLLGRETFYPERTYAYVMPPERSQDVDKQWDLYLVNLILEETSKRAIH